MDVQVREAGVAHVLLHAALHDFERAVNQRQRAAINGGIVGPGCRHHDAVRHQKRGFKIRAVGLVVGFRCADERLSALRGVGVGLGVVHLGNSINQPAICG